MPNPSGQPTAREIADRLRGRWMFHQACTSEVSTRAALAELRDATLPAFRPLTELESSYAEFIAWGFHACPSRDHAAAWPHVPAAALDHAAAVAREFGVWCAERHLIDHWLGVLLVFQLGHWARDPQADERLESMGTRGVVLLELEGLRELHPLNEMRMEAVRPLFDFLPARFDIEPGWRPTMETWTAFEARAVAGFWKWLRDYRSSRDVADRPPRRRSKLEEWLRWLARWRVGGEKQQAIADGLPPRRRDRRPRDQSARADVATVQRGCRNAARLIGLT